MTEKRPMVILTGPTAVGKTALSIELAKKINGSIISADSMQVYRHMDIGSAKVMPEEMDGVRHYLIDEFEPDEEFHVVKFVERAKEHLEEIYAEGKSRSLQAAQDFIFRHFSMILTLQSRSVMRHTGRIRTACGRKRCTLSAQHAA